MSPDVHNIPSQMFPSNPALQLQVPVVSSQNPWFEHVPSSGQSNSIEKNYVENV